MKGLKAWLGRVVEAERPPTTVIAFNLGLFETEGGYCAYLTGAKRFDPDDDDWACDEAFSPSERYFPVDRTSTGAEDWDGFRQEVVEALKAFLASDAGRRSFLAKAKAVTVGFDDGDLFRVQ
ncbi:hypothetical protein [Pelagibius sp.]|uniref:hypothetical protein n=1 Tax=Pelagibius sp. TaxID=1931238 RepID=UPI0026132FDF|nr:hypothetical protein [Pelagibius sp.]